MDQEPGLRTNVVQCEAWSSRTRCRRWSGSSARSSAAGCSRSSSTGSARSPLVTDHAGHGHDGPPTHTLGIVDSMTPQDLRACARSRRDVARRRAGHAAAHRRPRVRAIARRVPDGVRRDPRRPHRRRRREPVRLARRRSGRPAPRLRGPGAQPSASPARRLSRNPRPRRCALRADRAVGRRVRIAHHQHRPPRGPRRPTTPRPRRATWSGFSGHRPAQSPR